MKATPGPWFLYGEVPCVGGPGHIAATSGVAMCGMRQRTAEENLANAGLIVMTPDMYSVLVTIRLAIMTSRQPLTITPGDELHREIIRVLVAAGHDGL